MRFTHIAVLACASLSVIGMATPVLPDRLAAEETAVSPKPVRRRKALGVAMANNLRSKGRQAHPKRRRNRITISRRVRRKHRRAA